MELNDKSQTEKPLGSRSRPLDGAFGGEQYQGNIPQLPELFEETVPQRDYNGLYNKGFHEGHFFDDYDSGFLTSLADETKLVLEDSQNVENLCTNETVAERTSVWSRWKELLNARKKETDNTLLEQIGKLAIDEKELGEINLESIENNSLNKETELDNVKKIAKLEIDLREANRKIQNLTEELLNVHRKKDQLSSRLDRSEQQRQILETDSKRKDNHIRKLEKELHDFRQSYQQGERTSQRYDHTPQRGHYREDSTESTISWKTNDLEPSGISTSGYDSTTERKRLVKEHTEKPDSMSQDMALGHSTQLGQISHLNSGDPNTQRKRLVMEHTEKPESLEEDADVRNQPPVNQDQGTEILDHNAQREGTILGQMSTAVFQ